jgi:cytochrome c-type biogenesis protein CcmH/NrfG
LGYSLSDLGRKEAEQAYRQAVHRDPNSVQGHYQLGTLLWEESREKEAEEAYRQAIRCKPGFSSVLFYESRTGQKHSTEEAK